MYSQAPWSGVVRFSVAGMWISHVIHVTYLVIQAAILIFEGKLSNPRAILEVDIAQATRPKDQKL